MAANERGWTRIGGRHSMPRMIFCEVNRSLDWRRIGIDEALDTAEKHGRCPECHRRVRAHKRSVNGMAAHFEHLARNPACRLSDKR